MNPGAWIVLGAAVGAAGAIVGGTVDRTARSRTDLVTAAAAWLAATEAFGLAAQMDATYSESSSNAVGKGLERLVDLIEETLGRGRVELLRALVHRPLIRRLETISDRVWETTSLLVLHSPLGLLREIGPHLETLTAWTGAPRDPELKKKWDEEGRPAVVVALRRWTRPRSRRALDRLSSLARRRPGRALGADRTEPPIEEAVTGDS